MRSRGRPRRRCTGGQAASPVHRTPARRRATAVNVAVKGFASQALASTRQTRQPASVVDAGKRAWRGRTQQAGRRGDGGRECRAMGQASQGLQDPVHGALAGRQFGMHDIDTAPVALGYPRARSLQALEERTLPDQRCQDGADAAEVEGSAELRGMVRQARGIRRQRGQQRQAHGQQP